MTIGACAARDNPNNELLNPPRHWPRGWGSRSDIFRIPNGWRVSGLSAEARGGGGRIGMSMSLDRSGHTDRRRWRVQALGKRLERHRSRPRPCNYRRLDGRPPNDLQIHLNARAMIPSIAADIRSHQTRSSARPIFSAAKDFSKVSARLATESFRLSIFPDRL